MNDSAKILQQQRTRHTSGARTLEAGRTKTFLLVLVFGAALFVALWMGLSREDAKPEVPHVGEVAPASTPSPAPPIGPDPARLCPETEKLLAQLSDKNLSEKERRSAARVLAGMNSPEALEATKSLLKGAPLQVRVALAEGLGANRGSGASALLKQLLNAPERAVELGAIRALGQRADGESVEILGEVLASEKASETAKVESAIALGDIESPEAIKALVSALRVPQESAVASQLLEALGHKSFEETESFYKEFLSRGGTSPEIREAALLSLANAGRDAAEMLLDFASAPDPELRKAAAKALGMSAAPGTEDRIVSLIDRETVAEVRAELYTALQEAEELPAATVLAMLQSESDPQARISALHLAAVRASQSPEQELSLFFNQVAVPELTRAALAAADPQQRASAVAVLAQAATPEAKAALAQIATQTRENQVRQAAELALRKFPQ